MEWIECSQRMPQENEEVLVTYVCENGHTGVTLAVWYDHTWETDEHVFGTDHRIYTHWMELPTPATQE